MTRWLLIYKITYNFQCMSDMQSGKDYFYHYNVFEYNHDFEIFSEKMVITKTSTITSTSTMTSSSMKGFNIIYMDYLCQTCDKFIYDNYCINNPNLNDIDKIINNYVTSYNKKFDIFYQM